MNRARLPCVAMFRVKLYMQYCSVAYILDIFVAIVDWWWTIEILIFKYYFIFLTSQYLFRASKWSNAPAILSMQKFVYFCNYNQWNMYVNVYAIDEKKIIGVMEGIYWIFNVCALETHRKKWANKVSIASKWRNQIDFELIVKTKENATWRVNYAFNCWLLFVCLPQFIVLFLPFSTLRVYHTRI